MHTHIKVTLLKATFFSKDFLTLHQELFNIFFYIAQVLPVFLTLSNFYIFKLLMN